MTTAVRHDVINIPGPDNPDRIYLLLVPDQRNRRVVVRPGPSGQRLPRIWPMWFSTLLADAFEQSVYRIELRDNRVSVSTGNNIGKAIAMCQTAARQLYEVPNGALVRMNIGFRWHMDWHTIVPEPCCDSQDLQQQRLDHLRRFTQAFQLPHGYRMHVWQEEDYHSNGRLYERIRLEPRLRGKSKRLLPSLADVGKQVELHYMLTAIAAV